MSAGEIGQAGVGGGVSSAAKTLSDYYIKRAEQYHPVIPIGAGNEVTLVFQDGFQLETLEEARAKAAARKKQNQPSVSSAPAAMPGNTTDMLKHLHDFRLGIPSTRLQARLSRTKREPEYRPESHNPDQSVP